MLTSVFTMTANSKPTENEMTATAIAWLRDRLPENWEVSPTSRAEFQATGDGRLDAAIDLKSPNGTFTTMVVEVRRTFGPRDVDQLLGGVARALRTLAGNIPVLVIAPWLSERTRGLLSEQGVNYLDLTGNALIRLDNPTVFIQTQGATKDPNPMPRSKARVQGPKAGRLIRLLVDVRPPYGVRDLAAAAELTPGYVSRMLDTLDDEALVERSDRGKVEAADIAGLLRRWAMSYDVFRSNVTRRYLAANGAGSVISQLDALGVRVAVTGSFGASQLAPVSAPVLLTAYTDDPDLIAEACGLIPADRGVNVALLTPFDPVVWEGTVTVGRTSYVAPSQVAVDCLTGNGRMPAEGEALIHWMVENENRWRLDTLPAKRSDG